MKSSNYADDGRAEYRELRFVTQLREDLLDQVCRIHTYIHTYIRVFVFTNNAVTEAEERDRGRRQQQRCGGKW